MDIIVYIFLFIISLLTVKRFHKSHGNTAQDISGIFFADQHIKLPEEKKELQELLRPDHAGRQHELIEILNNLILYKNAFPNTHLHKAVVEFLHDFNKKMNVYPTIEESLPYHAHKGWGGIVVSTSFGRYMYIIGYYANLKIHLKNTHSTEILDHLSTKSLLKNSTNILICSADLDGNNQKIIHHGFGKKIDLIGCITTQ